MHIEWKLGPAFALAGALAFAQGQSGTAPMGRAGASSASKMVMLAPNQVQYGAPPASLPKGAQIAVLQGDPSKPGQPYAMRMKTPSNYKIPPHTHPTDEVITVLSGTAYLGLGDHLDASAAKPYPIGSFVVIPAGVPHWLITHGPIELQVNGLGPRESKYINPDDDPRHQGVGGAGQQGTR